MSVEILHAAFLASALQTSADAVKIDVAVLQAEVTGGYTHICSL